MRLKYIPARRVSPRQRNCSNSTRKRTRLGIPIPIRKDQNRSPHHESARPDSPYRTSTMALWGQAQMHPAPLSRKAVEKLVVERLKLAP